MKAYLFDTQTGLYAGETFIEADMLDYVDGISTVPPPEYGHGQVAVFDRERQAWALIPVSIARQLLNTNSDTATERQG